MLGWKQCRGCSAFFVLVKTFCFVICDQKDHLCFDFETGPFNCKSLSLISQNIGCSFNSSYNYTDNRFTTFSAFLANKGFLIPSEPLINGCLSIRRHYGNWVHTTVVKAQASVGKAWNIEVQRRRVHLQSAFADGAFSEVIRGAGGGTIGGTAPVTNDRRA